MLRDYINQELLPFYMEDPDSVLETSAGRFDYQLLNGPLYENESERSHPVGLTFVPHPIFSAATPNRMYVSPQWTGNKAGMEFETWRTENAPHGYSLWSGGTHGSPLRQVRHAAHFVQYEFEKNSFVHLDADPRINNQYRHGQRTHHLIPVVCCDDECTCLWLLPHDMEAYGPFEGDPWEDDETYAPVRRPIFMDYYDSVQSNQLRQFLKSMTHAEAQDALAPSSNFALHIREFFHGQHTTRCPRIKKRKWGSVAWPDRSTNRSILRKLDLWGAMETMKRLPVDTWSHVLTFLPYNEKCAFAMFYDDSTLNAYGCMSFRRVPTQSGDATLEINLQIGKMQELHKWRGYFDLNNFCNRHVHRVRVFQTEFMGTVLRTLSAKLQCATSDLADEDLFSMITTDKIHPCPQSFDSHRKVHERYMTAWVDMHKFLKLLRFDDEPTAWQQRACWYINRMNEFQRLHKIYNPNSKSLTRIIAGKMTQGDCALNHDMKRSFVVRELDDGPIYDIHPTVMTVMRQVSDMISMECDVLRELMEHVHRYNYFPVPCPYSLDEVRAQMRMARGRKSFLSGAWTTGDDAKNEFLSRHLDQRAQVCKDVYPYSECKCCGCSEALAVAALDAWCNIQDLFFMRIPDDVLRTTAISPRLLDQLRQYRGNQLSPWKQFEKRLGNCKARVVRPGVWHHVICPPQAWGLMDMLVDMKNEQRADDEDLWCSEHM